MSEDRIEQLTTILKELGIEYKLYNHREVFTIEDIDNLEICFEGQYCKNLFLKNSKGDLHYLVILQDSKRADLRKLARDIGSTRLSFADEECLAEYLQLKPGSVTPFGLIHDEKREVIVLLDKDLVGLPKINFHPNINTATVTVSYEGLKKFLDWRENKVQLVSV